MRVRGMAPIISRRGRWRPHRALCNTRGAFLPEERPWHPKPRRSGFPAHPAPCFPRDWTRPRNLRSLTPVRHASPARRNPRRRPLSARPSPNAVSPCCVSTSPASGKRGRVCQHEFLLERRRPRGRGRSSAQALSRAGDPHRPQPRRDRGAGRRADIPECTAVATVGSPFDPRHLLGLIGSSTQVIGARRRSAGRNRRARVPYQEAVPGRHPGAKARPRSSPGWEGAYGDAFAARHHRRHRQRHEIFMPRSIPEFRFARSGDHLLSEREDALYAGHVLAAWAERYLPS